MSAVTIIWKCSRPRDKAHAELCEQLMIEAAESQGMDIAEIRHGIHATTRVRGRTVSDDPHITGNIKNSQTGEGYALHYYVDAAHFVALPSTPERPNPQFWEL